MKRWAMPAVLAISLTAYAQRIADVEVKSAWVRPTVAGQMGTGAFMNLTSKDGVRIVGASSDVAGVVELHEMAMENNVMRMRPLPGLDLPPGSPVELKPGGHHMMLLDLKRPLAAGEKIKVELRLETRDKKLVTQPIEIEVRPRAP
ncbi:MAG TPA: copper chaperone PCu(A)C [Burkholderiaceae bacterium]|nr:copper chaperone PCu(A)C [Burkholderiaceae bacterium]